MKQRLLTGEISRHDFGIVEGEGQCVENLRSSQLWIAPENGLDLHAISEKSPESPHWHSRARNHRATSQDLGIDTHVRMWNQDYRKVLVLHETVDCIHSLRGCHAAIFPTPE